MGDIVKKIITIVGARPQFIKAATVSRAIAENANLCEVIVHTGQHYDENMSDIFFEQMKIPVPTYNLGVGGGSHGAMTGRQLEKIENVFLKENPDLVLVYGDTNSTLAGALAAAKLNIPVAHVEAGLRSYNRRMPEEVNRVLTDHISTLLFSPTDTAKVNLIAEGIDEEKIYVVGDVMYDASIFYKNQSMQPSCFDSLNLKVGEFILCTIHRAENTDDPYRLSAIFQGLKESELPVVMPLHPRTRQKLQQCDIPLGENIHIIEPVGYLEMVWLEAHCKLIATDSGGIQKEAYFHQKKCITLRDETEWVELVEVGANILVSPDPSEISRLLKTLTDIDPHYSNEIYGNGSSAQTIVGIISDKINKQI
jgi:UDP-GlcNAc3NAcA epimerase